MDARPTTKRLLPQIKPASLRIFHQALARWYKTHGRHDLPWRNTDDPYAIWVSEIMLQQTQVATVRDRFYAPFLKKFPTVQALATAPESAVMKAWEGLGYYSRARNLHKAAKQLVEASLQGPRTHGGGSGNPSSGRTANVDCFTIARNDEHPSLTSHYTQLIALPGIGRNTAHAILAFAYHQPVAILEANVKRVVARAFALTHPTDEQLWEGAFRLLGSARHVAAKNSVINPFDYNQAMMDLGALICTPKAPKCEACPVSSLCLGKSSPEKFPTPKAKKTVPTRHVTIDVREDKNGRLYLEQRGDKLLGGLWGFPQTIHSSPRQREIIGSVTHIYSHFKLVGEVVHHKITATPNSESWFTRAEISALALSKLDHKVLALVEKGHTEEKGHTWSKKCRKGGD